MRGAREGRANKPRELASNQPERHTPSIGVPERGRFDQVEPLRRASSRGIEMTSRRDRQGHRRTPGSYCFDRDQSPPYPELGRSGNRVRKKRVVQKIAPTAEEALEAGIDMATKIAACGPLGIKATLASAHLAIDVSEAEALSKLEAQYRALSAARISRKAAKQRQKVAHPFIRV
jgi:hypothetical protein